MKSTEPVMRRTTYTYNRTTPAFCPQAGDRIYSVSHGPVSFAPANGIVTDLIHTKTTTTFFTEDGATINVAHGSQILWEQA